MRDVLARGEITVVGRILDASNASLYATVDLDGARLRCVYKPVAGERPLWDFPSRTLGRREAAAYVVSAATGWSVVPPTVFRDGPLGPGSVQWWIDGRRDGVDHRGPPAGGDRSDDRDDDREDEDLAPTVPDAGAGVIDVMRPDAVPDGWLRVVEAEGYDGRPLTLAHADVEVLRRMAVFDAVVNNTDRKGGHVLRHRDGRVFGVDHGLTFSVEDKLRTVLWGWAGRPLPEDTVAVLRRLDRGLAPGGALADELGALLAAEEVERTAERVQALLSTGRYPRRRGHRPSIPWPPF